MPAPLLQTRDLSMHFGGVRAVRHVDFSLAEGELPKIAEDDDREVLEKDLASIPT